MQIVFVVGPTASGKSALAMEWAQKYNGAIVNCDSIQLYQELNIGSAKPSSQDLERVPHFLFDVVKVGEDITAGEYSRLFFEQIEKIKAIFPYIFVVGGTGFYFQAIEKGMYPIGAADDAIKESVEKELTTPEGADKLYQELVAADPVTAKKIAPRDLYRLGRAIEIMRTHGKSVTEVKAEFQKTIRPFPYPLRKVGIKINKEQLLPRVEKRTKDMLAQGILKEVESLLSRGYQDWAPLQSVGYKECLEFIRGGIGSQQELEAKIIMNTMRLAKKQRTWFQRDMSIRWISLADRSPGASDPFID